MKLNAEFRTGSHMRFLLVPCAACVLALSACSEREAEPRLVSRTGDETGSKDAMKKRDPGEKIEQAQGRSSPPESRDEPFYWPVYHVALAPDGKRGLSTRGDVLILWRFPEGQVIHCFEPVPGKPLPVDARDRDFQSERTISLLAVDWKSESAVTTDDTGVVGVWNLATGALLQRITAYTHQPGCWNIRAVAISQDGALIYTSGPDKRTEVKAWDLRSGAYLRALASIPVENYSRVDVLSGRRALLSGAGEALVWDMANDTLLWKLETRLLRGFAVAHDGSRILSRSRDKLLVLGPKGEELRTLFRFLNANDPPPHLPRAMAFAPGDHTRAITVKDDGKLVVWNVDTGKSVFECQTVEGPAIDMSATDKQLPMKALAKHGPGKAQQPIQAIAISAAGDIAIAGCAQGNVQLWDLKERNLVRELHPTGQSDNVP